MGREISFHLSRGPISGQTRFMANMEHIIYWAHDEPDPQLAETQRAVEHHWFTSAEGLTHSLQRRDAYLHQLKASPAWVRGKLTSYNVRLCWLRITSCWKCQHPWTMLRASFSNAYSNQRALTQNSRSTDVSEATWTRVTHPRGSSIKPLLCICSWSISNYLYSGGAHQDHGSNLCQRRTHYVP